MAEVTEIVTVTEIIESHSVEVIVETKEVVEVITSEGRQGPPGIKGDQGDQGEQGIPGVAGASYRHPQVVPSAEWVVNHMLGRFPAVVVVDSAGESVEGEVYYDSPNVVRLIFCAPFGGEAYLN